MMSGGDRLSPFFNCHQNFDTTRQDLMQCLSWPISPLLFAFSEYKRRIFTGWVSVLETRHLSRWNKSSFLLLSLAALCKFFFFHTFLRLIWMFQAVWGGGKEAQIVFCQHERHHLHPADCFCLLCDLGCTNCSLRTEKEESHLLWRDGTWRSSSAIHLQEGSWSRICATRWGELEG